jgi:hypothetical protein
LKANAHRRCFVEAGNGHSVIVQDLQNDRRHSLPDQQCLRDFICRNYCTGLTLRRRKTCAEPAERQLGLPFALRIELTVCRALQGLGRLMNFRHLFGTISLAILAVSLGIPTRSLQAAEFVTANFIVHAPNQQVAQKVGEYAERWRREKAMEWLGREMPNWGKKCPLQVTVTPGGSSGETTFAFDNGAILDQQMHVSGSLERILDSVLPHEVTHTVFAYRFRQPLPRWADEGGSVLSEDDHERQKHDDLIRRFLAKGNQAYRLRTLMTMMTYPRTGEDVITLYAEGYSIVRFLVDSSSKQAFLEFLADGIQPQMGWDRALQKHYGVKNIEQLEQAWLKWMLAWNSAQTRLNGRSSSQPANNLLASNTSANQSQAARVDTRNSTIIESANPRASLGTDLIVRGIEPENDAPRSRSNPLPGQSVQERPWSPVQDGSPPVPSSPGWRPLRASLGSPIPN